MCCHRVNVFFYVFGILLFISCLDRHIGCVDVGIRTDWMKDKICTTMYQTIFPFFDQDTRQWMQNEIYHSVHLFKSQTLRSSTIKCKRIRVIIINNKSRAYKSASEFMSFRMTYQHLSKSQTDWKFSIFIMNLGRSQVKIPTLQAVSGALCIPHCALWLVSHWESYYSINNFISDQNWNHNWTSNMNMKKCGAACN